MMPDPPAPLCSLPDLDRLEVLVPRGRVWPMVIGVLGLVLLGLVTALVAAVSLVLGLAFAGVLSAGFAGFLLPIVALAPTASAVLVTAVLSGWLQQRHLPVRADRYGLSAGGERIAWEIVSQVRADEDCVSIMLDDGEWLDVATELPQAAAWWLAASLDDLRSRVLDGDLDHDGIEQVRRTARREAERRAATDECERRPALGSALLAG